MPPMAPAESNIRCSVCWALMTLIQDRVCSRDGGLKRDPHHHCAKSAAIYGVGTGAHPPSMNPVMHPGVMRALNAWPEA